MEFASTRAVQQGLASSSGDNAIRASPQVVIMVPTTTTVKSKIQYEKRFPKKTIICLSSIQLCMAFLAIVTQIVGISTRYPEVAYIGAGIWCGIFFGLSGFFGMLAGRKPSYSSIVTFMVFSIIAASFCMPLLITSSIGAASSRHCWRDNCASDNIRHVIFSIQIIVALIQAAVTIASSVMTCRATCGCCCQEEQGVVYYTSSGGSLLQNIPAHQIIPAQQPQPGYITIPVNALQGTQGATALPTASNRSETPPPNYDAVAESKTKEDEGKGSKYQRLE